MPARTPSSAEPLSRRLGEAIPFGLWVAGAVSAIIVLIGMAVRDVASALSPLVPVLVAIAIALLFTALLTPLANAYRRVGLKPFPAAALTVILFIAAIVGIFWLTGAQVASGAQDLAASVSSALDTLQSWLKTGPLGINGDQIASYVQKGRDWAQENASSLLMGALNAGRVVTEGTVVAVLSLITTLFFLAEGRTIWLWILRLLPRRTQQPLHDSFRRGWVSVRAYVRTQIIVAAVDAVGIGLGALILGVPLVIPITLLVFLAAFIPVVGSIASGAVAVLIAFASNGLTSALIMLAIVIAVQQIESHVLQPVLMSKAVNIHPWAVIMGVTVFSYLFGIMGALIAVPILAMTKVVVLNLRGHDAFPHLGSDLIPLYVHEPQEPDGKDSKNAKDADRPTSTEAGAPGSD